MPCKKIRVSWTSLEVRTKHQCMPGKTNPRRRWISKDDRGTIQVLYIYFFGKKRMLLLCALLHMPQAICNSYINRLFYASRIMQNRSNLIGCTYSQCLQWVCSLSYLIISFCFILLWCIFVLFSSIYFVSFRFPHKRFVSVLAIVIVQWW